jgi:hypothetical protein
MRQAHAAQVTGRVSLEPATLISGSVLNLRPPGRYLFLQHRNALLLILDELDCGSSPMAGASAFPVVASDNNLSYEICFLNCEQFCTVADIVRRLR